MCLNMQIPIVCMTIYIRAICQECLELTSSEVCQGGTCKGILRFSLICWKESQINICLNMFKLMVFLSSHCVPKHNQARFFTFMSLQVPRTSMDKCINTIMSLTRLDKFIRVNEPLQVLHTSMHKWIGCGELQETFIKIKSINDL